MNWQIFFPSEPRHFPGQRYVKICLRACHVLCVSVFVGGYIFQQADVVLQPWLIASLLTGLCLFCVDIYSSLAIIFETRGMVILIKLSLLALVPIYADMGAWLLAVILLLSVISSHLPGRYRHFLFFFAQHLRADTRRG